MLLIYKIDNIYVMDNLYRIRVFFHLCKTMNFSESARQLHLAQPAISRHIKTLEDEVGSPLFLRYKKRVQLSEAGRKFYMQMNPILSEYDRVMNEFSENQSHIAGTLRIGSVPEAGRYLLMEHLIQFQKDYPEIELKIDLSSTDDLIEKLTKGSMDFALVSREVFSPSFNKLRLFKDTPVLVGRRDLPKINWSNDVIRLVLYREDDYYSKDFIESVFSKEQRKKNQVIGFVNSHESMLKWCYKSDVFAVIPQSSLISSSLKEELKVYKTTEKTMTLDLIYLKNSITELRKNLFIERMKKIKI